MSKKIAEFIERRSAMLDGASEKGPQLDARQRALADMLDVIEQHPSDAESRITRERDALKAIANGKTDDRLLWARVGEYNEVIEFIEKAKK